MKYETEINEMISIMIPKEDWMNDEDYQEAIDLSLKLIGTDIQGMSDAIEEGVKNGYSPAVQVAVLRGLKNTAQTK
jgi:hypothetical protein